MRSGLFSRPDEWTTFSSKLGRGLTAAGLAATVAAVSDPHKLIMNRLDNTLGLYDVNDPKMAGRNLLRSRDSDSLEQELRTYLEETGGAPLLVD